MIARVCSICRVRSVLPHSSVRTWRRMSLCTRLQHEVESRSRVTALPTSFAHHSPCHEGKGTRLKLPRRDCGAWYTVGYHVASKAASRTARAWSCRSSTLV